MRLKVGRPTFATCSALGTLLGAVIVIDADTVERDGVRYRLTGLDAPEIHRARCPEERRRGILAAARLIVMLEQHPHELVVGPRKDRYGRGLARLIIAGENWTAIAIREGHAVAWDGTGKQPDWCGKHS